MFNTSMEFLQFFGWGDFFEEKYQGLARENPDFVRGRIIGEERDLYRLQIGLEQIIFAQISGKIRFDVKHRESLPAVGDWVLCTFSPEKPKEKAVIHHVLPRRTLLQRKEVLAGSEAQNIAANIDYLFIAFPMSVDLNARRLERYLTMGWSSGAQPVVLLTKADLYPEPAAFVSALQLEIPKAPIHAVSVKRDDTLEFMQDYLQTGKSAVIIGSSGVGKSTLINYLMGQDILKTQEVRESDGKGRHTTTSRFLYRARAGGLIIDTPGMRELQLLDQNEGLQKQFTDIEELALKCKFSDCRHGSEPGCQIQAALKKGTLEKDRWQSYLKLKGEVGEQQKKRGEALVIEEKKKKKVTFQAEDKRQEKKQRKRDEF